MAYEDVTPLAYRRFPLVPRQGLTP
jgi:hypothetical protein